MRSLLLITSLLLPSAVMADERSMSSGSWCVFISIAAIIVIVSLLVVIIRNSERRRFTRKLDAELRPQLSQIIASLEDSLRTSDEDERKQLTNRALKSASNLLSMITMDADSSPAGDADGITGVEVADVKTPESEIADNSESENTTETTAIADSPTPVTDTEVPVTAESESVKITPLDESTYNKAVDYVVRNIKRPDLSVEELSGHLGMSRVHLYKKLKATTGKTPIEFIRRIRLKRGAEMLLESKMTVSEIAFQLGYNNPKYFSKYFREEFGVLPSVYQSNGGRTGEGQV